MSLDRGYTSDSEVYTDHGKPGKMHRSVTDVDVMNSGWLVVSRVSKPMGFWRLKKTTPSVLVGRGCGRARKNKTVVKRAKRS